MRTPVPRERVELPRDRAAWLERRAVGLRIGGSEVAAVLGCSPYAGPWDVLARRVRPEPDRDTPEQARGRRWERIALELYAEQTGLHVCLPGAPWKHDGPVIVVHETEAGMDTRTTRGSADHRPDVASEQVHLEPAMQQKQGGAQARASREALPSAGQAIGHGAGSTPAGLTWATCSPDAWAWGGEVEGWGVPEIKTTARPGEWGKPGFYTPDEAAQHVPPHYLAQALWLLEVTGLGWCDLVCLLPWYDLRVYRVYADRELQRDLLEQVGAWRQAHLVEGQPLPVDGSAACRRVVEQPPTDPGREATQEEIAAMANLWMARQNLKWWGNCEAVAANELLRRMGSAERVFTNDGWRVTRNGGLRVWQPREAP